MGVSNATINTDSGVATLRARPPASEVGKRPASPKVNIHTRRMGETPNLPAPPLDDKSPLDENYEIYSPRTNCISPTSIFPYINVQIYR